jgi:hypothetical protein
MRTSKSLILFGSGQNSATLLNSGIFRANSGVFSADKRNCSGIQEKRTWRHYLSSDRCRCRSNPEIIAAAKLADQG